MTSIFGHTKACSSGQTRELPGLSITATRRSADTQVRVSGTLGMDNANALYEVGMDYLSRGRPMVIDIKDAITTDTAGVAVLLHIYAVARENGCELAIVNPAPAVKKVLDLFHLDGILPIYSCQ